MLEPFCVRGDGISTIGVGFGGDVALGGDPFKYGAFCIGGGNGGVSTLGLGVGIVGNAVFCYAFGLLL